MSTSLQRIGCLKSELLAAIKEAPRLEAKLETDGDRPTLWIYGGVGGDVSAEDVARAIAAVPKDKTIIVRINSIGGAAYDGLAIYSALKEHGRVITRIDGLAASAAGVIALAGNPVQAYKTSHLFLHRALMMTVGNTKEHRDSAAWLEKLDDSIAQIVAAKAGVSREQAMQWLDGEVDGTLFSSEEAMNAKLIDVVLPDDEPQQPETSESKAEKKQRQEMEWPKNIIPSNPPGGDGEGVEGEWSTPTLGDFTENSWEDLDDSERREIASYFAFAFSLERFEDLKLPHHFPPSHRNANKASLAGVRNALARLPQTKGIPEADRSRIEAHLRAHLPKEDSSQRRDEQVIASALARLLKKEGGQSDGTKPD